MRRFSIVVAWIAFACIPTVAISVLIFGCCALPFHRVIHRILPVCSGIMKTHESHTPTTPATVAAKRAPVVFAKTSPKIATTIADVKVRSHTFAFITPAMTEKYKIPNPCTTCHTDKSTAWATETLQYWPEGSPWRME